MTDVQDPPSRNLALDGLRGLALVLVVLSHGWALWPGGGSGSNAPWWQVLRSGNLAVTVFLVAGGYLLIAGLMRLPSNGSSADYVRAVLRRVIRIAVPVLVLVVAILAVSVLDPTDDTPPSTTRKSAWAISTFTWNWYVQNSALAARADLGHLWYVSVFVQGVLLLTALFFMQRHRLWLFAATIGALLCLVIWWRAHLMTTEPNMVLTLLRTSTRIDGMLWGALLASTAPWWRRLQVPWHAVAITGLVVLLALTLTVGGSSSYFGWQGQAMAIGTVLATAGLAATDSALASRVLSIQSLAWLGQNSLTIYVWHYPVFFFVARHTGDWAWPARTAVGLALAGGLSYLLIRLVERPIGGWLRRSRWTRPGSSTA
ncbi:acyltransferase [Yimella sp. cx-51]|uniref:acyltransferase family protein n=1 Tax=Yimella sp. cx-51 TaxID=2770551 RepID=UPI00165EBC3F|nr:acyltransferase [Yimella sp. cx-51]MBC9957451.1 acyltransferase [Yimella sp. cx-51]QTH39312.1 acyltransferase [Yimella sp. cx-51]